MPAPAFAPPHPVAIFRVLKQAWRDYLASGNAASIDVTTPPNQLATATTVVAGTVYVDKAAPMPATASVSLIQSSVTKGTRAASITQATGAYTTTFPVSTMSAGAATAKVTITAPSASKTSGSFTVT